MGFLGADTDQLRGQSQRCATDADRLEELLGSLSSTVHSAFWVGPDADAFRDRFHGDVQSAVRRAIDGLRARGTDLREQAEQQDEASAEDGGTTTRGSVGDGGGGGGADVWRAGQEFYGDSTSYGGKGKASKATRPVGTWLLHEQERPLVIAGRELPIEVRESSSAGFSTTRDPFGNRTGTVGFRSVTELSSSTVEDLPLGSSVEVSTRIGMEGYAEAGGTIGRDGVSVGAKVGHGIYGETVGTTTDPDGGGFEVKATAYAGREAHANVWAHGTRGAEGQVNGFTTGVDVGTFTGVEAGRKYTATAPGGWVSITSGVSAKAGEGSGFNVGLTVSTDKVSIGLGGSFAKAVGLKGTGEVTFYPNTFVQAVSPGDYDADDLVRDGQSFAARHGIDAGSLLRPGGISLRSLRGR